MFSTVLHTFLPRRDRLVRLQKFANTCQCMCVWEREIE